MIVVVVDATRSTTNAKKPEEDVVRLFLDRTPPRWRAHIAAAALNRLELLGEAAGVLRRVGGHGRVGFRGGPELLEHLLETCGGKITGDASE